MASTNVPVTLETPIAIKVLFRGQTKKLKLPLKDLGAHVLPVKIRMGLNVLEDENLVIERYSDSAGAYVVLDSDKPQIYKTLFRAAKAKLKLRLRAHVPGDSFDLPPPPPPAAARVPVAAPAPVPAAPTSFCPSAETPTPHVVAPVSPLIARSPDAPKLEAVSPVSPEQPEEIKDEAPVPQPFVTESPEIVCNAPLAGLAFRPKPVPCANAWVVYCNNCNHPMDDEHFHCSVCDGGDYDLCSSCVESGAHCPGSGHWMVKRFVKNGCVLNSTTQRIAPKVVEPEAEPEAGPETKTEVEAEVKPEAEPEFKPEPAAKVPNPSAFTNDQWGLHQQHPSFYGPPNKRDLPHKLPEYLEFPPGFLREPTRTCNCCVDVLGEKHFVECMVCDDYDLCLECHVNNKHGHHPGHGFRSASPNYTLPTLAHVLCTPGRNARHSAVCDGCDKFIYGVRHKCLNCPDWDYCSECMKSSKILHPRHRFVPIYEPLSEPLAAASRHYGIYCDGPLCKNRENQSYIEGVRYKCAVCNDMDFCQSCEAHPSNKHNHTHPLIKFKTPVRSVSVTTLNDNPSRTGFGIARLGDQPGPSPTRSTSTETRPVAASTNAATQVQTIVDVKPSVAPVEKEAEPVTQFPELQSDKLDAHFVHDTIVDGTKIVAGQRFVQVWTLRNPGPLTWPSGCSVRHVGGDNMLNVDNTRALSQAELSIASESNVIGIPVPPGRSISFRVVMRAPERRGTAISYWRLKTADGMPFGHRLWCDVEIVNPLYAVEAPNASRSRVFQEETLEHLLEKPRTMQPPHPSAFTANNPAHGAAMDAVLDRILNQPSPVPAPTRDWKIAEAEEKREIARRREAHRVEIFEKMRQRREAAASAAAVTVFPAVASASISSPSEIENEQQTAELPVEEKTIKSEVSEKPTEQEPELESSAMIFPQLDKESPESSTHEISGVQLESPVSVKSTLARTLTVASEEFFEDAESVALHSDDDGFMTDEEYDILDASDEEMR